MEKEFYMVYVDGQNSPTYKHDTKESAETEAKRLSEKLGKKAFVLESKSEFINTKIESYNDALKYLGHDKKNYGLMCLSSKHSNAIHSFFKLITIAEAWNKIDEFTPDYSDKNQLKWFPWFKYSDLSAGFVYSHTITAASGASANVGSRLCFKTSERAKEFGEKFIDLWNDVLLFNNSKSDGEDLPF